MSRKGACSESDNDTISAMIDSKPYSRFWKITDFTLFYANLVQFCSKNNNSRCQSTENSSPIRGDTYICLIGKLLPATILGNNQNVSYLAWHKCWYFDRWWSQEWYSYLVVLDWVINSKYINVLNRERAGLPLFLFWRWIAKGAVVELDHIITLPPGKFTKLHLGEWDNS